MRIRSFPLIVALFLVLTTPLMSHAGNDHLEPVEGERPILIKNYFDRLLPLLHTGFTQVPSARYTVVPSFAPEYSWSLEREDEGGYVLFIHRLVKNFWYKGYGRMNTRSVVFSKELHDAVVKLFATATGRIRKIEKQWYRTDGVRFYFTIAESDGRLTTGVTHSPGQGSLMYRLTRLCDALMILPEIEGVSEFDMMEEIDALLRDMQKGAGSGIGDSTGEWRESAVQRRLREHWEHGPDVVSQEEIRVARDMSENFTVSTWGFAWHRNLREPVTHGTEGIPLAEILAARDAVIADLERRGEERFAPDLFMNELTRHVVVIEIFFQPRSGHAEETLKNRTYYVRNGTIIDADVGKKMAWEHFRPLERK